MGICPIDSHEQRNWIIENSTAPQMPPRRSTPSTSPIAGNEELEGNNNI